MYPTVHSNTSPDRLSVIGRLLGLSAAAPAACRVLDLGCGQGTDIIVKAAQFPNSHFTGVDFSSPDINTARRLAAEAGVRNVEFHQADLLQWKPDGPPFDYIIAYGLFSWVPDDVKERLLEITAKCLAPQGIACISYLTYPGCKQAEALRDIMELRAGEATGVEKARIAREVLGLLDRAYSALPKKSYSASMLDQVRRISTKEDNFLLHDDLGLVRDPVYFLQFVNMAADHGLHYLGDTEFQSLLVDNLPSETIPRLYGSGTESAGVAAIHGFRAGPQFPLHPAEPPSARSDRPTPSRPRCVSFALPRNFNRKVPPSNAERRKRSSSRLINPLPPLRGELPCGLHHRAGPDTKRIPALCGNTRRRAIRKRPGKHSRSTRRKKTRSAGHSSRFTGIYRSGFPASPRSFPRSQRNGHD